MENQVLERNNSTIEEQIPELVIRDAGQKFNGADFRELLQPGVYVCLKDGRPTYVGMGDRLLCSVSRRQSHAARSASFADCDTVLLYPCKSLEAAKELEKLLIVRLQPTNNKRGLVTELASRLGVNIPNSSIYKQRQSQIETRQSHHETRKLCPNVVTSR